MEGDFVGSKLTGCLCNLQIKKNVSIVVWKIVVAGMINFKIFIVASPRFLHLNTGK